MGGSLACIQQPCCMQHFFACIVPLQPAQNIHIPPFISPNGQWCTCVQQGCSRKLRKQGIQWYSGGGTPQESKECEEECRHRVVGSHRKQGRWGGEAQGVGAPQEARKVRKGGKPGAGAHQGKQESGEGRINWGVSARREGSKVGKAGNQGAGVLQGSEEGEEGRKPRGGGGGSREARKVGKGGNERGGGTAGKQGSQEWGSLMEWAEAAGEVWKVRKESGRWLGLGWTNQVCFSFWKGKDGKRKILEDFPASIEHRPKHQTPFQDSTFLDFL